MNRYVATIALALAIGMTGCLKTGCQSPSDLSFPTLLDQAVNESPRLVAPSITLEKIERPKTNKLEFRYRVDGAAKVTSKNTQGQNLQKVATEIMSKDPLAISASENQIAIEHIFNDVSGSLIWSFVMDDESATMPQEAGAAKSSVTGVQANPFLK